MTNNVAYLRISHTESLNGTSLDVQESKCKAYAELHGFKIDKVFSEIVSGSVEFRKRPVFQKALSELGKGSKLVVARLDRASRSVLDTLKLVKDFEKNALNFVLLILVMFIRMLSLKFLLQLWRLLLK